MSMTSQMRAPSSQAEATEEVGRAAAPRRRERPKRTKSDKLVLLGQLSVLPLLLLFWQLGAAAGIGSPLVRRTPEQVFGYLKEAAQSGELVTNVGATMQAVLIAFVLSAVVGVAAGMMLALLPRVERIFSPYLDAINSMPRIALAPVFIIIFGISTSAKVAMAFSLVVFIVMSNTRAGVLSADADIVRLTTITGATRRQMITKVYMPVAFPAIFAGLRLGLIYSLLGVVASELIAAREGVGLLVSKYSGMFRMEAVYGLLIVIAIIASALNVGMRVVERRLLRWQPKVDK